MKTMRTVAALMAAFICSALVYAQDGTHIENRVSRMKEALRLTDDQAAKITAIFMKEEQEASLEKQSAKVNKKAMVRNSRVRLNATDKEIEKLLNPEQLKKYQSYKKERKSEIKRGGKGRKFRDN